MGSEASERSEKNSITTSKATQRGTVTFPVDLYFKCSGRAALIFFFPWLHVMVYRLLLATQHLMPLV